MTKSVSRVLVVVVALAAVLSLTSAAQAQDTYASDDPVFATERGSQYQPAVETANSGFLGYGDLNPQASGPIPTAGDTTTVGGTGGGLAITGSETDLPLAIGIGLLALGGTALVGSRKRDDE